MSSDNILKQVVEQVCNMNDPKYINSLMHIAQVCHQKADVLTNLQDIQNRYNAAQNEINKCNEKLKELLEG